eukprot:gene2023-2206_t
MRQGQFEITLLNENGQLYKEQSVDSTVYAIATPGAKYHVQIKVYPDEKGDYPARYLRFGLYVDGRDVQYWKRLDLSAVSSSSVGGKKDPQHVRFWGFKKNTDEIISFVFAIPNQSIVLPERLPGSRPLGSVKAVIYAARLVGGVFNNLVCVKDIPKAQQVSQNEKVMLQPSLTTSLGERVHNEKFVPNLAKWENISSQPLATLELRYHTEQTLNILQGIGLHPKRSCDDLDQSSQTKKGRFTLNGELSSDNGNADKAREVEEAEVVIIETEKVVPLLDLTDDTLTPAWQHLVVRRSQS